MSGGRVAMLVIGLLIALVGLPLTVGGGVLLWAQTLGTDDDGYLTSPTYELSSDGYAILADDIELVAPDPSGWLPFNTDVDLRVTAQAEAPDREVFIGVGPVDAVTTYLQGVPHTEVIRFGAGPADLDVAPAQGDSAPGDPTAADFWVVQTTGTGAATLDWQVETGDWAGVIMNADAAQGLAADTSVGVRLAGILTAVGAGLLVTGLILVVAGLALVIVAVVRRDRQRPPAAAPPPPAGARTS